MEGRFLCRDVVGFIEMSSTINSMACAAAGSNNTSYPCYGTPHLDWDTCSDPDEPYSACAHFAADSDGLHDVLQLILADVTAL